MDDLPVAPAPEAVDLDRETALTVRWADGTEARFDLADLRSNCPCAECRGLREQGRLELVPNSMLAEGAELVGNWGITIFWRDGHRTGIYSWGVLSAWAGMSST